MCECVYIYVDMSTYKYVDIECKDCYEKAFNSMTFAHSRQVDARYVYTEDSNCIF